MSRNILEIDSLRLAYRTRGTVAYAMNGATLHVREGEAVPPVSTFYPAGRL